MSNNTVVLRLFLKAGPPVDLLVQLVEADKVLVTWKAQADTGIEAFVGGRTLDGVNWGADLREVSMIVVAPYSTQVQQIPGPMPGLKTWYPGMSGAG